MKNLIFQENGMRVSFRINDDRTVELVDFSVIHDSQDMPHLGKYNAEDESGIVSTRTRQLVSLQVTGRNSMRGYKHNGGSESFTLQYEKHEIQRKKSGKLLRIEMTDGPLGVNYYMLFLDGTAMVRTWTEVINRSDTDIGIDYISSFIYEGLCKNGTKPYYQKAEIYVPRNSWSNEAQISRYEASGLGLSFMPINGYHLPDSSNNRFHYGNCGSWSTCEYLPISLVRDEESGEIFYGEIDFSGSWTIEYGSAKGRNLYIALMGPDDETMWWKNLKPGEVFRTAPAAFGVCLGDVSDAIGELTKYRRAIRRPNLDDERCNIIFNDYMNCLFGDPTQEKEKEIIDIAADLGCEYYCMDCGWYDKGEWWDKVGEWFESSERFPDGMKSVFDYCRSKGMKMGMWLEIEAMGTACPLSKQLPDSWFICNHGKRRIENKRYLLDFRNPDVRQYCSGVIDRLIRDYGCEYFKIDYNVTTGPGSDVNTDSRGQANLEHYRALYDWYKEIYNRYPNLVIENCGSGAQRADYGMLELQSLQSASDQTDYLNNSFIAANIAAAVTPEQAGMWVYPYEDDAEHVIYNMVNGILLRPYISGSVWAISSENMRLLSEGISVYKDIRENVRRMLPFFPLGFSDRNAKYLAYGVRDNHKAYMAVWGVKTEYIEVPLDFTNQEVRSVKVLYPHTPDYRFVIEGEMLRIVLPQTKSARLFELQY